MYFFLFDEKKKCGGATAPWCAISLFGSDRHDKKKICHLLHNWDHPNFFFEQNTKPRFQLFITPVYIWGPSSQLQGLRESIGVAIRLNRTLLLPPFLTHNSDPKGESSKTFKFLDFSRISIFLYYILIFVQNLDFCKNFDFLYKIFIFVQTFNFVQHFDFCTEF